MDKRGDRRGDGRPKSGLEQPSGPPRERGRRRGLRRVGDSRPGRGDRGDKLEKDAGLRAPGTRRGESWQADRNNVCSLRAESIVDCEQRAATAKPTRPRPIPPREDGSDESYCQASETPTSPSVLRQGSASRTAIASALVLPRAANTPPNFVAGPRTFSAALRGAACRTWWLGVVAIARKRPKASRAKLAPRTAPRRSVATSRTALRRAVAAPWFVAVKKLQRRDRSTDCSRRSAKKLIPRR